MSGAALEERISNWVYGRLVGVPRLRVLLGKQIFVCYFCGADSWDLYWADVECRNLSR